MDLNTISLGLLSLPILYLVYLYFTLPATVVLQKPQFLWGEQVGRTRSIQSKNGDASMATEMTRRRTIHVHGKQNPSAIKERTHGKGSGTGAIETFFLTSICPPVCLKIIKKICEPYDVIFDGGYIDSEFCPVLDDSDGNIVYDAGGIDTIVCGE
jgi:hypothetical protein